MAPSRQDREARQAHERLRAYEARQDVHRRQGGRRRRDNIVAVVGVVVIAALATVTQIYYFSAGPGRPVAKPSASASATPTPSASATGSNLGAPDKSLAADRTWTGSLTLNSDVDLKISLDGKAAPQGVSGFIRDVQDNYFVGKTCHRLAKSTGFGILQCGSIDGQGGADSSYHFGPVENAPSDNVYPAGTIAMARASGDAYSNGHQFFIVFDKSTIPSDSAGGYTVIGKVTSGLDTLKSKIVDGGITPGSSDTDGAPKVATSITAVTIQ